MPEPPEFPAGPFVYHLQPSWLESREEICSELRDWPARLREVVADFDETTLDLPYRNWSVRQIVHHLADSHLHGYIRTKWTLAEASPLIKAYDESEWSALSDARELPVESSLMMLEGTHLRWSELLRNLAAVEMERTFFHPQLVREITIRECVANIVWHGRHHAAQIAWVRENRLPVVT